MEYIKAKTFNFDGMNAFSKNQLTQHYTLYEGYVKKINEIWTILDEHKDYGTQNVTYSPLRSLMLGQSFALDGVKLHELYFENIATNKTELAGNIMSAILKEYGSYSYFKTIFSQIAMSVRGWVVLGIDRRSNKLCIFGSDAHDVGAIWCACPLLVLDMYEHAYIVDFGIVNKAKYIETFIENIDWNVVNERIEKYQA